MIRGTLLTAVSLVISLVFPAGSAEAQGGMLPDAYKKSGVVTVEVLLNCPADSIQGAVYIASGPTIINVQGVCEQDVLIAKDDITLTGKRGPGVCNKVDPSASAWGTINGTITVDGVRAKIELLEIMGSGPGVKIINGADVRLFCNDISNNQESGVIVLRASNAVLRDNNVSANGQRRINDPSVFFDAGLFAADASSVLSLGNTYKNNQFAAINVERQASFTNGAFLPREPGPKADPNETDVYTEKGCDPNNPGDPAVDAGCFSKDEGPLAISVFNKALVDLRNFQINGGVHVRVDSSFRLEANGTMQGHILNQIDSLVRIRDRFTSFGGDRGISYTGQLFCFDTSQTYFANVQCSQICSGLPSTGKCRFPECNDGIDNDGGDGADFGTDPECTDIFDDDESS